MTIWNGTVGFLEFLFVEQKSERCGLEVPREFGHSSPFELIVQQKSEHISPRDSKLVQRFVAPCALSVPSSFHLGRASVPGYQNIVLSVSPVYTQGQEVRQLS